ncbi:hypothetical protein FACS18942_03810 [Planctomycetales bacterium]|nr:hypothetical protein FACS18942_03810 [Planctomycetales bacterium]GHT35570.1 hypothetical protein FACS189427_05130 [Planctomycetales bacterium]
MRFLRVFSFAFIAVLLAVAAVSQSPLKADVVLSTPSGVYNTTASVNTDQGNGTSWSETFTLANPDSSFTSLSLDAPLDYTFTGKAAPSFAVTQGTFAGTINWSAYISVDGEIVKSFTQNDDVQIIFDGSTEDGPYFTAALVQPITGNVGYEFDINPLLLAGKNSVEVTFTLNPAVWTFEGMTQGIWYQSNTVMTGPISVSWNSESGSPTPEPATLLIFGLGIAGAGVAVYRRKRK